MLEILLQIKRRYDILKNISKTVRLRVGLRVVPVWDIRPGTKFIYSI